MWATLGLTLIVGVGLGVALDRLLIEREGYHRHGERGAKLLAKLSQELELTPEQQAELEKTIASNRERAHEFWSGSRASFETLRQEFRRDIRALLNPEQQKRFDEMVAREDEKRKRRHQDR
jgi:Spy/CpxP family protein refolding chaperone